MKSDHWYHELFKAMPDLVRRLIPELANAEPLAGDRGAAAEASSDAASEAVSPEASGDTSSPSAAFGPGESSPSAYTFRPVVLKKSAHSPDAVLWPRQHPGGSETWPVVLLEVQMHADPRFHRRLAAETFRLLQQQAPIEHLRVLVLLAHRRLNLGPTGPPLLRRFLDHDVTWVDLEALARQPTSDPALALLTLPVQPQPALTACCQHILERQPTWIEFILPILSERFIGLSTAQLMATLGISKDFWRHTRAFQEILQEGRSEGLDEGRRVLALQLLERRCGRLSPATIERINALDRPRLEQLALALLDFQGAEDLERWLQQPEA
ncbi:MAG: DUF2887 domain-containing protein [Synechococcaceae cyanobacterium]